MSSLTPEQAEAFTDFLRTVPLFAHLHEDDFAVLTSLANRQTFRAGEDLFRQSDKDGTLYIIYSGDVRLIHIDTTGTPTDVGRAEPGRMLGESSLLVDEPHDVTALALTEVTAIVFTRNKFMLLRDQDPHLWGRLAPSEAVARRLHAPQFGWLAPDEIVIIFARQHWWGLLRRMFFPLVGLLIIAALVRLIQQSLPLFFGVAVGIGILALFAMLTYVIVDWRNDYWVVTNRRIVHVDELVFVRKLRNEAPLPSITQVQYERRGFASAIFDFGDLMVETFTGTLGMRAIGRPMYLRQLIEEEVETVKSRERAAERKGIRDDLSRRIIGKESEVEIAPPEVEAPAPPRPSPFVGAYRYFFPKLVDRQGDVIIWHRHWIIFWRNGIFSTLAILVAIWAFLNWYNRAAPVGTILEDGAWWIWPLLFGGLIAWWWWVFEDWRNDEYMLTANRVVEINRTPFSLSEKRQDSPLSDFQSTELKVVGPFQKLLRYGTLIVKLPGAQIEFQYIKDPAAAQTEITKRLDEYNKRRAEREAQARRNELSEWFAAYDEIRQRERVAEKAEPPQGGQGSNGRT